MSERNFASPPKTGILFSPWLLGMMGICVEVSLLIFSSGSKHPGPSSYNNAEAADATMRHFPAFTIACRKDGRKLGQCTL